MMKIIERKTKMEGTFVELEEGKVLVTIDGQQPKTIAESTFKRNYKIIKEDDNMEVNEMEETIAVTEVEEEVIIEDVDSITEEVEEKSENVVEKTLTPQEELEIKIASEQLSKVILAMDSNKATFEKNGRNTKLSFVDGKITMTLEYNNSLMDEIVESVRALVNENREYKIKYINQQKRPNPSGFKARGVIVTNIENGEKISFSTRKKALLWIENEHTEGRLANKPSYYHVRKALENNGEYMGYNWKDCDPSEIEELIAQ